MKTIEEQKLKLEQKKNRLILQENKLRVKEQKMHTRHLIEIGELVVKAGLDNLPSNTLYGALISLQDNLRNNNADSIKAAWTIKGNNAFNKEKKDKIPMILKFKEEPNSNTINFIRSCGLHYNKFRQEWHGLVNNLKNLKEKLQNTKCQFNIEIIKNSESSQQEELENNSNEYKKPIENIT